MSLQLAPPPIESRNRFILFDDFFGNYNARIWTLSGGGSVSYPWPEDPSGRALFDGWTGGLLKLWNGAFGHFTVATNAQISVYGSMTPGDTGSYCEVGFQTATTPTQNDIKWRYKLTSGYFQAVCRASNVETAVDSTVAVDNSDHEFGIMTSTGRAVFFLDGRYVTTITTNIPTGGLTGYLGCNGGASVDGAMSIDWVLASGDRI